MRLIEKSLLKSREEKAVWSKTFMKIDGQDIFGSLIEKGRR